MANALAMASLEAGRFTSVLKVEIVEDSEQVMVEEQRGAKREDERL